jgi:C-terminal processing protease CtpA/Prc
MEDRMNRTLLVLLCSVLIAPSPLAVERAVADDPSLFAEVVSALERRFYDESFRTEHLPALIKMFEGQAREASTLDQQRAVVHDFLSRIPASHLALVSQTEIDRMFSALSNEAMWTFGFETIELDGELFAHGVWDGGPAMEAGLLVGDRLIAIDDAPAAGSDRLDWRSDDAALPDPPIRALFAGEGDTLRLLIERAAGEVREVAIPARQMSAFDATTASARVIEHDRVRIGHIHLWMIHFTGPDRLIRSLLEGPFRDCDAFILDLRGRGGNAMMVPRILDVLADSNDEWTGPLVALIDDLTRSAKEAIAWEIRDRGIGTLVGARTAGALLPATFQPVGDGMVLMFPTFTLRPYTERIESRGVEPHVAVEPSRTFTRGRDAILEAGLREAASQVRARGVAADHDGD